jgi:hypothetical protein
MICCWRYFVSTLYRLALVAMALLTMATTGWSQSTTDQKSSIDFGLQIRPILSEHCFHCHGPDPSHREADLRLDDEASAKGAFFSGSESNGKSESRPAIAPGNLDGSELWSRIHSQDPDRVMPPPSARKTVTPEQKELIARWIQNGAHWGSHWSLSPIIDRDLPDAQGNPWARTPIDAWVLASMNRHGLTPAPPAEPTTLIRRMYLDLIGLPPTAAQVQQFVQDYEADRARAIESLVDRLLENPAFGEHWARLWLDLARYADTKGYEKDLKRDMWPYRDWVIAAFNQDMPFDKFSFEQLAGDLATDATVSQRIATAFHRTTLSNDEGGTDDEEYRVAAVKDRVDTTLQVWMGLTAGCAKCHSHKYDPISMEDYYRIYAIFNQTEDADRYDDEPRIQLPSQEQQATVANLEAELITARNRLQEARSAAKRSIDALWIPATPIAAVANSRFALILESDRSVRALADRPERDTYIIEWTLPAGEYRAVKLDALHALPDTFTPKARLGLNPADPNFVLSELHLERLGPNSDGSSMVQSIAVDSPRASFEQNGWPAISSIDGDEATGWAVSPRQSDEHWIVYALKEPLQLSDVTTLRLTLSQQYGNRLLLHRVRLSAIAENVGPWTTDELPEVKVALQSVQQLETKLQSERDAIPKLPILRELAGERRRTTRIHQRGSFLDPGEEVTATLPQLFPTALPDVSQPSRAQFARWLFDDGNPLTARVMTNRIWAQLFGRGIIETEEDFGSQGALPTHPELLDHLASTFRHQHQWSLKALLKSIVLSNTYQQSFQFDATRQQIDPRNDWLSRSARFRLSAEVIRDQALAVSGLLSDKQGGPPVMPPQPEGLWRSTYSGARWVTSPGQDRFRRGLYTFWKRTTPYPSLEIFDATTREVCQIRRIATNTPLQALVTLNDPVYTESSIAMARLWLNSASSDRQRIQWGFLNTLSRPSRTSEEDKLLELLRRARAHYVSNAQAATDLVAPFPSNDPSSVPVAEVAAWSMLTSAVLNLDEFLMHP